MQRAASLEAYLRDPFGRCIAPSKTVLVWCESPTLCGAIAWGRPTREDVETMLRCFEGYLHPSFAPRFSVVLDGREIDGVDPDAFVVLQSWLAARRAELARRIEMQMGVVSPNLIGLTLSGILPVIGDTHRFRVVNDPLSALTAVSDRGAELWSEIEREATLARGVPEELQRLRDHLRARPLGSTLAVAARALTVSERCLQRVLQESGTTFRDELKEARFLRAKELLEHGDDKVAVIAGRVGLSEGALTQLIRDRTGQTPAELRKASRVT